LNKGFFAFTEVNKVRLIVSNMSLNRTFLDYRYRLKLTRSLDF